MTQNINLIPTDPSLKDLLDFARKDIKLNLNCHHIGTIQAFNALNQTAQVSINYTKTFLQVDSVGNSKIISKNYPLLVDCPVVCVGGGTAALTFPITSGDECLVMFNDRDMSNWFGGSSGIAPSTGRLHAFTDAIVLVGIRSAPKVILNYDGSRAVLRNGLTARVAVSSSEATLENGTTIMGVGATKATIKNATLNLNTILQNLLTQLEDLNTAITMITVPVTAAPGVSGVPVNAATFTMISSNISTIGTQLGQLLE